MLTMVADHLRYLWPAADGLFIPGRLAFPLFCLAIAVNIGRGRPGTLVCYANARYLGWLLVFSLVSEAPYRWLDNGSATLNVIPTLTLGLLVAWGVHYRQPLAWLLAASAAVCATLASEHLMYGLPGVLLPAACLTARQQGGLVWLLPCTLAAAGNLTNSWLAAHLLQPVTLVILATAALALPLGNALLQQQRWAVAPVGRWGYGFYPLHLLALKGLLWLNLV